MRRRRERGKRQLADLIHPETISPSSSPSVALSSVDPIQEDDLTATCTVACRIPPTVTGSDKLAHSRPRRRKHDQVTRQDNAQSYEEGHNQGWEGRRLVGSCSRTFLSGRDLLLAVRRRSTQRILSSSTIGYRRVSPIPVRDLDERRSRQLAPVERPEYVSQCPDFATIRTLQLTGLSVTLPGNRLCMEVVLVISGSQERAHKGRSPVVVCSLLTLLQVR